MTSQDTLSAFDVIESPLAGTHDWCDVIIDGGGLDVGLGDVDEGIGQTLDLRDDSVDIPEIGCEIADELIVVGFMVD